MPTRSGQKGGVWVRSKGVCLGQEVIASSSMQRWFYRSGDREDRIRSPIVFFKEGIEALGNDFFLEI